MKDDKLSRIDKSLSETERDALETLEPELRKHAQLTELAFNTIGIITSRAPELPIREVSQPRKVCVTLLVRLSNDLRCAALLALRGYAVQALSLVASMYEAAYTIAAIGSDDNLAQDRIDHDDPTHSFRNVRSLTLDGLKKLGHPDPKSQLKTEYRVYRQLCLGKHST